MKKSFSLIEIIFIVIIIGVLYSTINFSLKDTSLYQAANQLITHINYTRHLALIDNKMQYYPIDNSNIEMNRSKYWFKQWWQIRFSYSSSDGYWYEIFTDLPTDNSYNFDQQGNLPYPDKYWEKSYAMLNNRYLVGHCDFSKYPSCSNADKKLNLTQSYGIKKIIYTNFYRYSKRLIFDNDGNVYLKESNSDGDNNDINPYDKNNRMPLLTTAKITLCKDLYCKKNISICILPKTGKAYICK